MKSTFSLKQQLSLITKFNWAIEYISNPHLEVQLIAVKQDRTNINFIENPSIEVQLLAKLS